MKENRLAARTSLHHPPRPLPQSTFFSYGNAYAEGILRRGQKKGEERSVHYARALRRTRDAKAPGPKGLRAGGRPLRCAARPMSPHRSSRRAWWIASPARNVDDSIWEERALVFTAWRAAARS